MSKTQSEKNLWQKMSEIQGMNLKINKNKKAHSYKYATLDKIMETLNPLLAEKRLLLYHETNFDKENNKSYLRTVVRDIDDQLNFIESITYLDDTVKLPSQNQLMVIGSQITYFRRYHVTSLFGLSTEEDTDAGGSKMSGSSGRSVDSAARIETGPDFVTIFSKALDKNKSEDQITKLFNSYKSQMKPDELKQVENLINNKFKTEK